MRAISAVQTDGKGPPLDDTCVFVEMLIEGLWLLGVNWALYKV